MMTWKWKYLDPKVSFPEGLALHKNRTDISYEKQKQILNKYYSSKRYSSHDETIKFMFTLEAFLSKFTT